MQTSRCCRGLLLAFCLVPVVANGAQQQTPKNRSTAESVNESKQIDKKLQEVSATIGEKTSQQYQIIYKEGEASAMNFFRQKGMLDAFKQKNPDERQEILDKYIIRFARSRYGDTQVRITSFVKDYVEKGDKSFLKVEPPPAGITVASLQREIVKLAEQQQKLLATKNELPPVGKPDSVADEAAEPIAPSRVDAVRAQIRDPGFDREAALFEAAGIADVATVGFLLTQGVDVTVSEPKTERTALHVAALSGELELVRVLLSEAKKSGVLANVIDMFDLNYRTPLLEAVVSGNLNVVRLLLDHGAEIDAGGRDGRRALHLAVLGGEQEIVDLLLERGAHVLARDLEGRNARQYATALRREDLAVRLKAAAAEQSQSGPVRDVRACVEKYLAAVRVGDLAKAKSLSVDGHRELFDGQLAPAVFEHVIEDIEVHGDEARAIVRIVRDPSAAPLLYVMELSRRHGWFVSRGRGVINDRWEDIR